MPLDVGLMDREIVIETATVKQDPVTNQEIQSWDAGETVFAQWLPATAREVWQARQIEATIEGAYKIHYRDPPPTPDDIQIIGHDGRRYDVKGVTEIGRKEGLLVTVTARGEGA